MPRGKPNSEQGSDPRSNKMEAVRLAMQELGYDASPLEIMKYIKDKFDQDMNPNMISSYKSNVRKKAGMKGRRKKHARPQSESTPAVHVVTVASDAVPWKDLRIIKDIAGRIGKKGLRELVELLD